MTREKRFSWAPACRHPNAEARFAKDQLQHGGVAISHSARLNAPQSGCAPRRCAIALALFCVAVLARPASAPKSRWCRTAACSARPPGITTTSPAFGAQPTIGNEIVVLVWTWSENNPPSLSITDSAGNTYLLSRTGRRRSKRLVRERERVLRPGRHDGSGTHADDQFAGQRRCHADRGSRARILGTRRTDQANSATGSSAAASVSTNAATSNGNELVVSVFGIDNPASCCNTISAARDTRSRPSIIKNSGDTAGAGAQQILTTVGVQSTTFTVSLP
jgi:hypothetical protein